MEQKLKKIMTELFKMNGTEISDDLAMKDTDVWDSFKHMELITSIEQEMGVELTFDEIVAMKTFKDIKRILTNKGVGGHDELN